MLATRRLGRPSAYDAPMFRSGAHATVAVVALAAGVYATASLSGGWLGEPPWWREWVPAAAAFDDADAVSVPVGLPYRARGVRYYLSDLVEGTDYIEHRERVVGDGPAGIIPVDIRVPRAYRESVSVSIAFVGFALFALAAWRRRDRPGRVEEPVP